MGTCIGERGLVWLTAVALSGCYSGQQDGGNAEGGMEDADDGDGDGDGDGGEEGGAVDEFCEDESLPGRISRFVRLTHRQYDNTVADLLGVAEAPGATFIPDPALDGFSNNAEQLRVNDPLARDYRRAAETIAADLATDAGRLATIVPCDPAAAGCAAEFVADFGARAFRRPLLAEEQAVFEAIFAQGQGLYETGSDFDDGVAMVVEAVLQSPSFLYRSELSAAAEGSALVALDGYEIASRLSYMMWNSMPDDALRAAAAAGELDTPEGIEMHARRLLDSPRAADPIEDFHDQWLGLHEYDSLAKDPGAFPDFGPETAASMRNETLAFVQRVALGEGGTFAELMTSSESFVDSNLADIYGVPDPGPEGAWVELDPAVRSGLLTHSGFLAAHAYFAETSPIHRGVFVQRQVLCATIPDPPGDADLELPPADGELVTTRDRVEHHTSPDACVGCHQMINEPGFAFEAYDAVGRLRSEDNGAPIDASGVLQTADGDLTFDGAVDLSQQLADHPLAQRCYLTQWFRYASARSIDTEDACTLGGLHDAMLERNYDIRELLVSLTQTVSFRYRNVEGE
ncbi:MAG: DUF1592 domain-containing protein [Myxococcota bacterium]